LVFKKAENQTALKKWPLKKKHYNLRHEIKTCKHKKYEPLKVKRVEASTGCPTPQQQKNRKQKLKRSNCNQI
jgi:hypothetical protein